MHWEKIINTIYSEKDLARSIATASAGLTGLLVYTLVAEDWFIAMASSVVAFPVTRVIVDCLQSFWKSRRIAIIAAEEAASRFKSFSPEEQQILEFFVKAGGCCVSWGFVNSSQWPFPRPAVNSLIQRGVVRTSVMEDGMSESFVLDVEVFDLAQNIFGSSDINEKSGKDKDRPLVCF